MKTEHKELQQTAKDVNEKVIETIRRVTTEKPLILFDSKADDLEDEIYDYPYGFFVSKYNYYIQGQVMSVKGNEVVLFLTGEDWGEFHDLILDDLPIESLIDLLSYLDE